jgi:hypothetical protein
MTTVPDIIPVQPGRDDDIDDIRVRRIHATRIRKNSTRAAGRHRR